MISTRTKEKSGITLLALVVTIIVLLILSGVTISAINSNNGVLTQAKRATITSDLSKYKEEVELYKASKQMEGTEKKTADGKRFEATSLNANYQEKSLVYNTQDGNETGDITTIIPDLKKDYHDGKRDNGEISVTNGQMVFKSTNDELYKIAQDLGIEVDPYNVKIEKGSDGKDVAVLTSSDKNLRLAEAGVLTLPYDIEVIDSGTFSGVKGLKKIIIPYTVKEIRNDAFSNNQDIEEIVFQTKDKQGIQKIGSYAFYNCQNLTKINYNENDDMNYLPETLKECWDWCFAHCTKLENINIPGTVTNIPARMFDNSIKLNKIILNEGTKNITGGCFVATQIDSMEIPSSVTYVGGDNFYACYKLTNIKIKSNEINVSQNAFRESRISSITLNNECKTLKWADSPVDSNGKETTLLCGKDVVYIYPQYLSSLRR